MSLSRARAGGVQAVCAFPDQLIQPAGLSHPRAS
jgi:hypothetical protein